MIKNALSQIYQQAVTMKTNSGIIDEIDYRKESKQKAQAIIHQLTLLSPSLDYLEKPINLSNEYISAKSKEIEKLKGMKPIVVRVYSYMFQLQRDQIYEQLTIFVHEIEKSVNKARQLIKDLDTCVGQLIIYTDEINDETTKKDYLGIVSVNKLKIATIEQKISHCEQQIVNIDKFRTVTLHHLNDTVQLSSTKIDSVKEYSELELFFDNYQKKEKKIKSRLGSAAFIFLLLSAANYLATFYHFKWTSTVTKEVEQTPPDDFGGSIITTQANELLMGFEKLLSLMQLFGAILALPMFIMFGVSVIKGEFRIQYMFMGIALTLPFTVLNVLFASDSNNNVTVTTHEVVKTLDIFNLGISGSCLLLSLSILCIAAIFVKIAFSTPVYDALGIFSKIPNPKSDSHIKDITA